jgi:predicted NUDIX family NTP pyrophosphohydrolase
MADGRNLSAGLLLFRRPRGDPDVFLAQPGGPFRRGRDVGAWTIPKGLVASGEELLAAAAGDLPGGLEWHEAWRPTDIEAGAA